MTVALPAPTPLEAPRTCYYCDTPCTSLLCPECQEDENEAIAQAFTAQVKKEHEAVLAFLKKQGIKPR